MRNWLWITLAVLIVVGGVLLFMNNQQPAKPQTGIGGGPGVVSQPKSMEVKLDPEGKAVFEEKDGKVTVTLELNQPEGLNNQPAHIHVGSCPGVGEVLFPLSNVIDGKSVTEINTTIDQLKAKSPLALNVHKSGEEITVYTACGNLPK